MKGKYIAVLIVNMFASAYVIASPNHHNEISGHMMDKGNMDVSSMYGEMESHLREMSRLVELMANTSDANERLKLLKEHKKRMTKTNQVMHNMMEHDNEMHMR